MIKYCYGCGVKLQDSDSQQPGYIKNVNNDDHLLCYRCFRMKNHNEYHSHYLEDQDFKKIIYKSIKPNSLIVLVVDLFDLAGTLTKEIINLVKNNPIVFVANKKDLLPKSLNDRKLKDYLRQSLKKYRLDIKDILLVSSTKKHFVDDLLDDIYQYYDNRNIYVVGITNAGKSSVINALINAVSKTDYQLSISNYPGTTLDSIKIDFEGNTALYDTPGLVNKHQMIHYLNVEDYPYLLMNSEVKQRVYQLNEQQLLYVGGLACLEFVSGDKTSFYAYFNTKLNIHRSKLEQASRLYNEHLEDDLLVPKAKNVNLYQDFIVHKLNLNEYVGKKIDIAIAGLGWFSFEVSNQQIRLLLPKDVSYSIRNALI